MPSDRQRTIALRLTARLLPRPASPLHPRRLLFIRPDHIGDLILAGPALTALRASLPKAHLALLVGPWGEAVARRGPGVDELLTCPFPGFTRCPKRNPLAPYRLLIAEARKLRGRYDLALVARPDHWWGALLARLAGLVSVGYAGPTTTPLLGEALALPPGRHAASLNLDLAARAAELAGGDLSPFREPPAPTFRIDPDERSWAAQLADASTGPLIVLHPGSGSALKNWPPKRWAAVADALASKGAEIVVSGGPDDLATPRAVAQAMQARPTQLAGQTSLGQLGALIERSALVLGTDNGPLHLAAALGRPTLRLYGPSDPARYGPWPPDPSLHLALTHDLPCRPCGNLVAPPCGALQDPPCLLGLSTDSVIRSALTTLSAAHPACPTE